MNDHKKNAPQKRKVAAYLSKEGVYALNNIRAKIEPCRNIEITALTDAVELSAIEFSKILDGEYSKIKSASTRPMMGAM